jgi:hypothetical protein
MRTHTAPAPNSSSAGASEAGSESLLPGAAEAAAAQAAA